MELRKQLYIGIDISINSTGICYYTNYSDTIGFTIVNPTATKLPESGDVLQITYDKGADKEYRNSEICKIQNGYKQAKVVINHLFNVAKTCSPTEIHIVVEAPPPITSFGKFQRKSSSTLDMIRNNSIIMADLVRAFEIYSEKNEVEVTFEMISNKTIKWEAGNGAFNKSQMIDAFLLQDKIKHYAFAGKIDDIADAYFACKWRQENLKWLESKKLEK